MFIEILSLPSRKGFVMTVYYNPRSPSDYELCLKNNGYDFRFNELSDTVEYKDSGSNVFEKLTDGAEFKIRQLALSNGLSKNNMSEVIRVIAENNKFHPIKDYFNNLVWNGKSNITELASYVTDSHGVFPLYLEKWFVGAVAKLFDGGIRNPVLVMDGAQLIGKSTFVRNLCWDTRYFKEGAIRPDNNDHEIDLTRKFIWEISELENTTSKSAVGALKDFLSRTYVTARVPYGKHPMEKTSITSFIGTVNDMGGFLNDDSGSTRFRVSHIISIDFNYSKKVDISQCWAEAFARYKSGERTDLSKAEEDLVREINSQYQVSNPIEDAIKQYFIIDPADTVNFCTSFQIRNVLLDKDYGRLNASECSSQKMASCLKKLGCNKKIKKFSSNTVLQVYYGIQPRAGILLPPLP
mgnify:CR=1 FL=1